MKAHIFQHVPYESEGAISTWIAINQHSVEKTCFFSQWIIPDLSEVDLLIVLGGPMGVYDDLDYPWLAAEKQMLKDFIDTGKPVLGICLGSQLIADALAADVYRGDCTEVGWFDVMKIQNEDSEVFSFPDSLEVFHWHSDTFDLPKGAIHLLNSAGCENQAFQVGKQIFGLQFHLEVTQESIENLIAHSEDKVNEGKYIQPFHEILNHETSQILHNNRLLFSILDYLEENYHESECISCLKCCQGISPSSVYAKNP
ncbi:MAG: amidotransferase [Bacteroidota bacterium]